MSKGILYIISGPSGTGKGTVCEELKKDENIFLSVSTTSRDQRAGEVAGVTYNYTTPENFEKLIADGEMLEWAKYGGNYYGTPKSAIIEKLNEGKDVILEIEPQGALKVESIMPECIMIFIAPPSMNILKQRLDDRGRESTEQIRERLQNAVWEFNQAEKYDHIVVNDDLFECVNEIKGIMNSAKQKRNLVFELLSQYDEMKGRI